IIDQSMINIIAVLILEYGSGVFGILQLNESEAILRSITDNCAGLTFDTQPSTNEILHIIVIFFFAILFSVLTYPLFRKYEWSIYEKISIDEDLRKAYRARLIFTTCLKNVAMFAFLYIFLSLGAILPLVKDSSMLSKVFFSINLLMQAITLALVPLAFYGASEESKSAMISFMIFGVFVFANYGYLLGANGGIAVSSGFVFWLWFTIIFLILFVVTFVTSIFTFRNFGEGLKPAGRNERFKGLGEISDGIPMVEELKEREHNDLLLHKRIEDLESRDEIWLPE
ncbi:1588_t:CDS:2, partial [Acaulospora morrowiae]